MTHGTRSCYQAGCRELSCKAANADYWRAWWRDRQRGRPRLGSLISGAEARKRVKQLQVDGVSGRELSRRLGLKPHSLVLHSDAITVRKHLRIVLEYRRLSLEGPDTPLDASA